MSTPTPRRATGEREAILARIRSALKIPTSEHVKRDGHTAAALHFSALQPGSGTDIPVGAANAPHANVLPPVGDSLEDRIAKFAERSAALKTDFQVVGDAQAAVATINALAAGEGWKRVAFHACDLLSAIVPALSVDALMVDRAYDRHALEQCDAGITVCDALIAQTGSVLLTAPSAGGRALSVLPPHHVVVATAEQLLPDLPAAYALLASKYAGNLPSFATFITGPSRTGDIERILVLGAHGPKKLTVILINPS